MPFITGTCRYICFHNEKDIPSSFYYDRDKYITSGACTLSIKNLTHSGQLQPTLVLALFMAVRWDGCSSFRERTQSLWNTLSHIRHGYCSSQASNSFLQMWQTSFSLKKKNKSGVYPSLNTSNELTIKMTQLIDSTKGFFYCLICVHWIFSTTCTLENPLLFIPLLAKPNLFPASLKV